LLDANQPRLDVVRALAVDQGDLLIGGSFLVAPSPGLVRWTGTAWQPMPAGLDSVRAIRRYQGRLYVGGDWTGGICVQDGNNWTQLGLGLGTNLDHGTFGLVNAMVEYQGVLHVTGWFNTAGGRVSAGFAHWGCACWANCDNSPGPERLNVGDFVCFLEQFAARGAYADCDRSGAFNAMDFVCFQSRFAAGCP
jgi:hypothetical protein